ncbi:MAG: recombinase family protein, partial [Verrucomicrobia bacterium]|nr:recombinase family protein [Verrucomicrobiota bacterium]
MKQAAMYVRVSTQQQKEGATIESQKALLLQYAEKNGFEIHPEWIFEDNGVSGSKLARPALDRLRDFASEGLFEDVFILSPDRLSRKYAYQAILLDELAGNGVKIHFQNTPDPITATDHLLIQMQGMFAEYERAQITERSRRGKKHKAKNGSVSVLSVAPYGYRYIKGEQISSFFEINEKEASIVRTIFDLYVKNRFSIAKIKMYLLDHQVRSPKGNSEWSRSTINGILKNSAYRGIAYFGKREPCEPISTRLEGRSVRINGRRQPKRTLRLRDPKDWIEISVPAIIDYETFEIAQGLLKTNKTLSIRNAKPGSLLQGLISCNECGYGFITTVSGKKTNGYGYYRCSKRDKKCTNRSIRIESLDETIWESLISILESPDLVQDEVSRRLSDLEKAPILKQQKLLENKLEKLEVESNRLLDAYQSECIDLKELKNRMGNIKRERNNIRREIAGMDSGLSRSQLLGLSEAVKYFSNHLRASQSTLEFVEKRKILRMLIHEIQIGKEDITVNHIIPVKK